MKKRIIALLASLAILFTAVTVAATPTVAFAASAPFAVSDVGLDDLDGTTTTLSERYGGTKRIVIVGKTCADTPRVVNQALALAESSAYDEVNFLVLDSNSLTEEFRATYASLETERVRFYSCGSFYYENWAWNTLVKYNGTPETSAVPIIIAIDENDRVIYASNSSLNLMDMCEEYFGIESGLLNLQLYDIDGTKTSMEESYNNTRRVVIVGRPTCGNTKAAINMALNLAQKDEFDDISFLVLDLDGKRTAFQEAFASMETGRVRFFSDDSNIYYRWAWDTYKGYTGASGTVTLPFIFVIDENNQIKYAAYGPNNLKMILAEQFGIETPSITALDVRGYVNTDVGRALLDMVNEARAAVGAGQLVWDSDLAETAIQRASELGVYYSHTRPDGNSCFSAWPSWSMAGAENIAKGQTSAAQANTDWTNSPGHYANMINEDMVSFAAALYRNDDGDYFWVECFSGEFGPGDEGSTVAGDVTSSVTFDSDIVGLTFSGYSGFGLMYGFTAQLYAVTLGCANLVNPEVTYTSGNTSVATVSADGLVTTTGVGKAAITATLKDNPLLNATIEVTVNPRIIDYAYVYLDKYSYPYTGSEITPGARVMMDGDTLVEGKDYTVAYSNNTDIGTATVTVTGKGNYTGSASATFSIVEPVITDISDAKVTAPTQTYTGEALTPAVTVKLNGETLVAGEDYTFTYSNNTNAGTATIKVSGQGSYSGEATGKFTIAPANIGDALVWAADQVYTGAELKPTVTVKLGGKTLTTNDFTATYASNTNAGTATITVTGKGNYTGSAKGSFTISAASLNGATVTAADQTWTGSALEPKVTVVLGGKELSTNDYTVAYDNNTAVGTATITVTGKDNYSGSIEGHFKITEAPPKTGWQKENGSYYFYGSDGKPMTDHWESYDGNWYYFGADGKLVWNGWSYYEGVRYYMGSNGRLARNTWASVGGKYYYIGSDYRPVTNGWATYGGKYYYMGADGTPQQTGWVSYAGKYYYLQNYNPVVNQWVLVGDTYYHFNKSGVCDNTWKAS